MPDWIADHERAFAFFGGVTGALSFVTVSPPIPFSTPIAFTAVTLSMDAGAVLRLAVREKALPNFDPFEQVTPSLVGSSITAIRFRYLRGNEWLGGEAWDAGVE